MKAITYFMALLIIVLITFFIQQYIDIYFISSRSMENTLIPGDKLLIYKFKRSYLPIRYYKLNKSNFLENDIIKHGQLLVFNLDKKDIFYVKRCIGLPYDTIKIINGIFYINSIKQPLPKFSKLAYNIWHNNKNYKIVSVDTSSVVSNNLSVSTKMHLTIDQKRCLENNPNIDSITIYNDSSFYAFEHYNFIVQNRKDNSLSTNYYFMIGDNQNNSIDSRQFGPVPEENIVGKVVFILFNYHNGKFRWDRFLKKIE
jgi:signal peptidase I